MKKKLFGIAIVAMIAIATAWNVNENKNEITLSDLTLDNVEALASGEYDIPGTWYIYMSWEGGFGNTHLQKTYTAGGTSVC